MTSSYWNTELEVTTASRLLEIYLDIIAKVGEVLGDSTNPDKWRRVRDLNQVVESIVKELVLFRDSCPIYPSVLFDGE